MLPTPEPDGSRKGVIKSMQKDCKEQIQKMIEKINDDKALKRIFELVHFTSSDYKNLAADIKF